VSAQDSEFTVGAFLPLSHCFILIFTAFAQDLTQRMMLATWLIEIFLSKISQLEDIAAAERASEDVENYTIEETIVEEDMRHFLKTYKVSFHVVSTIYNN
jgi:hypothetical protein